MYIYVIMRQPIAVAQVQLSVNYCLSEVEKNQRDDHTVELPSVLNEASPSQTLQPSSSLPQLYRTHCYYNYSISILLLRTTAIFVQEQVQQRSKHSINR
jgi:DNA/RNA endonuclease G (NUC1)